MTRADLQQLLSLRQQAQEAEAAARVADDAFKKFAHDLASKTRAEMADGDGVVFEGMATWMLDGTAITLRREKSSQYYHKDGPWMITDVLACMFTDDLETE